MGDKWMSDKWFLRGLLFWSVLTVAASIVGASSCAVFAWRLYPQVLKLSGQVTWEGVRIVWEYGYNSVGLLAFLWLTWSCGRTLWRVIKEF